MRETSTSSGSLFQLLQATDRERESCIYKEGSVETSNTGFLNFFYRYRKVVGALVMVGSIGAFIYHKRK